MALLIGGTLAYFFLPFPWWVVVVAGLVGFEVFELLLWRWVWRTRPRGGHEAMVGERGHLSSPTRVRLRGTSYPARVLEGAPGDPVEVVSLEGMTLVVRRVPAEDRSAGSV